MDVELLSAEAVGKVLGCSPSTVKRLVQMGHLGKPFRVAGRLSRWSRAQVQVYLARLTAREFEDEPRKKPRSPGNADE